MSVETFNLTTLNLASGTHLITVKSKANGYRDSAESNAVSYKVSPPSFTIEAGNASGTYYYESGMTWAEWVKSEYNTAGFITHSGRVVYPSSNKYGQEGYFFVMTLDGPGSVSASDVINLTAYYSWWVFKSELTLITFTIDGTTYQAVKGMHWHEWYESEYNTSGYVEDKGESGYYIVANKNELIYSGEAYTVEYRSHGGSSND